MVVIPETIQIGGHVFVINTDAKTREKLQEGKYMGTAISVKNRIDIDTSYPESHIMATFMHECCHIISDLSQLELTEAQVTTLGNGLQQVLLSMGIVFEQKDANA